MQLFSCKWNILHIQSEREKTFLQGRHSNSPTHQLSAVWKFSCINTSVTFSERVSQFGPKDSVSEGEASPSLLCEAKVCYIRWSLTNSSYNMTLKMLKFTQRLVSSETLQLSLFSPSPRYSVISNQIITSLPTIVMTSCIVVYMGAWFTGAWSARGRGCTAAAGSVWSVHINEMFHMKPC